MLENAVAMTVGGHGLGKNGFYPSNCTVSAWISKRIEPGGLSPGDLKFFRSGQEAAR
jgi:hypothetical protein